MINIENLSKNYGKKEVLKTINLQLEAGSVYGIVGENGAGKTTLFRSIAGLEKYDGKIIASGGSVKNQLGFLMTEPFIFPKITGKEYLQLLCDARKKDPHNIKDRNIFDLPLNQYASTYSTGMKKKLAFTGILLQENSFFILDEPYNGVDIQSNILITDIIIALKNLGKIILISSHIFTTLRETCDEIHLLEKGSLIRRVEKDEFDSLESYMKAKLVGNKISQLNLK